MATASEIQTDPFLTDEFHKDPARIIAELRENDPVHLIPGLNVWVVTRYEDVRRLFTDPNVDNDPRLFVHYQMPPEDSPRRWLAAIGATDIMALSETELAAWRSTSIGFIFQFYNLIPVLNALENVELPLLLTGLSRKDRREHAEMALQAVNLADRMDHYPSELSGGQQQRVAIARAVVTDPLMLVADEPTGDLDRVYARDILDLMCRLNAELGKTIIMVTHDPRAAERAHIMRNLDKGN